MMGRLSAALAQALVLIRSGAQRGRLRAAATAGAWARTVRAQALRAQALRAQALRAQALRAQAVLAQSVPARRSRDGAVRDGAVRVQVARGPARRAGRSWRRALVPAALVALMLGFAVPALARTPAHALPAHRGSAVSLRTLVRHVNVRSEPSNHARIVGTIRKSGTVVAIACYAMGTSVAGNPVWYRISAPVNGYITSYYTTTHLDPAAGVAKCRSFSRPYHTVVKGLHVRTRPTTAAKITTVLGKVGTKITVNCYSRGQDISGDPIWYHIVTPRAGYVAGLNLDTGYDPAAGVPACA